LRKTCSQESTIALGASPVIRMISAVKGIVWMPEAVVTPRLVTTGASS